MCKDFKIIDCQTILSVHNGKGPPWIKEKNKITSLKSHLDYHATTNNASKS